MISFAAPVKGGEGGVVGSDVFLTKIAEQILQIKLDSGGYAFYSIKRQCAGTFGSSQSNEACAGHFKRFSTH